jgi:hypothetical protein
MNKDRSTYARQRESARDAEAEGDTDATVNEVSSSSFSSFGDASQYYDGMSVDDAHRERRETFVESRFAETWKMIK